MSPGFQLALGCFLVSSGLTYALWSRLRVVILQTDLARIGNLYACEMTKGDQEGRETDREFFDALDQLIDSAPSLSPAIISPIARLDDQNLAGMLGPDAEPFLLLLLNEDRESISPKLRIAIWSVGLRLARYLAFETLTGWLAILRAIFVGVGDVSIVEEPRIEERKTFSEARAFLLLFSHGRSRRHRRVA